MNVREVRGAFTYEPELIALSQKQEYQYREEPEYLRAQRRMRLRSTTKV